MSSEPTATNPSPDTLNDDSDHATVVKPIIYDLPAHETASQKVDHLLRATKEKFAARANRFGEGTQKTPSDVHVLGARRAHVRGGFVTGFDTSTEAERQKRENRKKRFHTGPQIDDPEKRKSRADRFGINAAELKEGNTKDPLERRRDVAIGEIMRPNIIHVFGVDQLSTADVMTHFVGYGPSWCEWLNDSSCNVAFEDQHTMKRVLNDATVNSVEETATAIPEAPVDKMGDEEGDGASMNVAGEGALPEEAKWRVSRPIIRGDDQIPLWIRQATEKDKRPEAPNPKSLWSRTVRRSRHQEKGERRRDKTRSSLGPGSQSIPLGVRKADSIAKARVKKVSREDLFKALSS